MSTALRLLGALLHRVPAGVLLLVAEQILSRLGRRRAASDREIRQTPPTESETPEDGRN